jgi:mRNA-degrading endonuclease RelE of RelBE toxin-antitoxin system
MRRCALALAQALVRLHTRRARRRRKVAHVAAPRRAGRPLGAELAGIYSARLGRDWRVLYEIDDAKHVVIVLDIRHRSAAYRRR